MNPNPVAAKKEWKPQHTMTQYEYNNALDTLDMLTEYCVMNMAEYEKYRGRIDRMVED